MDEQKRIPQDIANLLAICIRDLMWYKDNIIAFLKDCGVPRSIIVNVENKRNTPTLKLIPEVLEELYSKGDDGFLIARDMLTRIYYWKDVHSIPADRKDASIASLKELQQAYKKYTAQETYQREKRVQANREDRLKPRELNHQTLQQFRDRFDSIFYFIFIDINIRCRDNTSTFNLPCISYADIIYAFMFLQNGLNPCIKSNISTFSIYRFYM